MFICQVCKSLSPPNVPAIRVVTERRPRTYDLGGGESVEGWEIAAEALACAACAAKTDAAVAEVEAARKRAEAGKVTLGEYTDEMRKNAKSERDDLFQGVHAVEDYSDHEDAAPPIDVEPVPAQKIEEAFPKAKKQRRKKVEAN